MEVSFYPAFNSLTIEDGYNKTGEEISQFIANQIGVESKDVYLFYEGKLIEKTATPSVCGAQDEDSLMCYVKTRTSSGSQLNYYHGTSNRSFNTSQDFFLKRSSTAIASAPVFSIESRVETDREYADRCMKEGRYTSALCELKANRSLQLLFFQKLQNIDQKLFKILKDNSDILEGYIEKSSSLPKPEDKSSQLVLLNQRDNENLLTICDMMNLDLTTATMQYLESNRNMDEWAQRFVVFFTFC